MNTDSKIRFRAIIAPHEYISPSSPENKSSRHISVFIAGGVSGSFDWQQYITQELKQRVEAAADQHPSVRDFTLVVLNPRREMYDVSDKSLAEPQIKWEFEHFKRSDAVMFWFPKETLCPIALFELGAQSRSRPADRLFVATDPDYQRKTDVIVQLSLAIPSIRVVHSLDALADQFIEWYVRECRGRSQN